MAYAVVANMGLLVAALGTGSRTAAVGAVMLLLARVLALVLLALRAGASERASRLADGAATMTLAGTPGLAGFPGLWLILAGTRLFSEWATAALALGSFLLFATAIRRTLFRRSRRATAATPDAVQAARAGGGRAFSAIGAPFAGQVGAGWWRHRGPDRAIAVLIVVLVLLGLVPGLVAAALADPLREIYFPIAGP